MDLQTWRAQGQTKEFVLPSGLEVTLKKISLVDLATRGSIPQTLKAPIEQTLNRKTADRPTVDELAKFAEVARYVAKCCIVSPPELEAEELPWEDVQAIYAWANEVGAALVPFRKEQNGNVESSQSVRSVRKTTE